LQVLKHLFINSLTSFTWLGARPVIKMHLPADISSSAEFALLWTLDAGLSPRFL
jgi:hypothetical protein